MFVNMRRTIQWGGGARPGKGVGAREGGGGVDGEGGLGLRKGGQSYLYD